MLANNRLASARAKLSTFTMRTHSSLLLKEPRGVVGFEVSRGVHPLGGPVFRGPAG